ncbi:MAG: hypothetical protein H9535_09925 [Ignavibacteria bacterium]|nr:hypothetical protein [Ignavibacteria bacterium]
MHNVYLSPQSRLRGMVITFALIAAILTAAVSCTDPNTIGGPNVITTTGNGSGTALLSQRDRIVNGFQLEPPQESGMSSNITFNGEWPIIDLYVYRRTEFRTDQSETTVWYGARIDTAFAPRRASVNIAERTIELLDLSPRGLSRHRLFTNIDVISWNGVERRSFPTGKLRTNFYIEPLQLEENSIDLPPAVKMTAPAVGAVIERSKGATLQWDTPINYDTTKGMFAEVVIVANVKDKERTTNAPSLLLPVPSAIKRIPNGATSVSFSREELAGLPADYAGFAVNLYTLKAFRNNTATIMATTHSFVQVELK